METILQVRKSPQLVLETLLSIEILQIPPRPQGQIIKFLQPQVLYTSPASVKTILIGGTFANNTNGQVSLTIQVLDQSTGITVAIASKIPVPAGSSFVISDTGKTLLEGNDALKVACDTAGAIDANISILTGVN